MNENQARKPDDTIEISTVVPLDIDAVLAAPDDFLAENGIKIFRNAFDPSDIGDLLEVIDAYRADALAVLDGAPDQFHPALNFRIGTMAANLFELDPATKGCPKSPNLVFETSLMQAIRKGPSWAGINAIFPDNVRIPGGRVRIVDIQRPGQKGRRGALQFHQERWVFARGGIFHPPGYNIWMCLNPDGRVSNVETPGLQFAIGEKEFWHGVEYDDYENVVQTRINKLNSFSKSTLECKDEFVEAEDGYVLYRPHLRVGDVAIFDHHVLHGSFHPAEGTGPRVSCELRAFPLLQTDGA